MRGERLFRRWFDLVEAPPPLRLFILAALNAPHRHWHGLLHHALMLRAVAATAHAPADTRKLVLATLFHDIVYEATRSDNEEASAEVARRWLTGAEADDVAALILATKAHDLNTDPVTRTLLDADLAVLWTANSGLYAAYAKGIRAEYAHVPDAAYRAGRAGVLRHLVDQLAPSIPPTKADLLARNVEGEIARLQAGEYDLSG